MKEKFKYNFVRIFKLANLTSLFLVLASLLLIFFKGLNFGIDFKGGTLIELRIDSKQIGIANIRSSFSNMGLGDLSIKEFGKKGDYLIKFENKKINNDSGIKLIKEKIIKDLQTDVNFRRVENVGPKVSSELLKAGF